VEQRGTSVLPVRLGTLHYITHCAEIYKFSNWWEPFFFTYPQLIIIDFLILTGNRIKSIISA